MMGVGVGLCALLCLMMFPQIMANIITKILIGWYKYYLPI